MYEALDAFLCIRSFYIPSLHIHALAYLLSVCHHFLPRQLLDDDLVYLAAT